MDTIYADYQASTPIDPRVLDAMTDYWRGAYGNPHSSDHIVGWRAAQVVEGAAQATARLIGADADEIVFTSGATEANNLALMGLARRAPPGRNRILVSAIEHKCVLETARALAEREDFIIETIPVDREGFVIIDALRDMLDETALAASVMAVNNEIGTIQDIAAVSEALEPHGTLLHCDAAQAPCAMDTNKLAEYADLISLSAHKFYGPQGIGALYIRRSLQPMVEPIIHGGGQQNGLRSGTVPVALCVGMAAAADAAMRRPEQSRERRRIADLRDLFVRLMQASGIRVEVNGRWGNRRHPGNANLRFVGRNAADILSLAQPRLAASTGAACASGITEPSHVLHAIGLSVEDANASVRFSFGRFSDRHEIESAVALLGNVI